MLGLVVVQNSSTMVYCKTETNLCPPGPEMWECPTNKGTAAVLPRYSSAACPAVMRCTSAEGTVATPVVAWLRDRARAWRLAPHLVVCRRPSSFLLSSLE